MPGGAHTFRNQSDRREVQKKVQNNIAYLVHVTHFDNIGKLAQTWQISPNKFSNGVVGTQIITKDQIGMDLNDLGLDGCHDENTFFILNYEKLLAHMSDFYMTLGWNPPQSTAKGKQEMKTTGSAADANLGVKGTEIHKRFFQYKTVPQMSGLEWFSPIKGYGSEETYGPIIKSYTFIQEPALLDLRKKSTRTQIEKALGTKLDPDDIYSGGQYNKIFHSRLRDFYKTTHHGTYIDDPTDDVEWDGAQEVVLWKGLNELLRENERQYDKSQLAQFMSDLMQSKNKQNEVVFQSSIPLWIYMQEIWVPEGRVDAVRKLFPDVLVTSPNLIPNRRQTFLELVSQ